jgi:outer membrane immunogenic protein
MIRPLLSWLCLLAVMAAPAVAADAPQHESDEAPAHSVYDWTGFHVGINGGGIWGQSKWSDLDVSPNPKGGLMGGTVGYSWQVKGPWVIGLEGDGAWADVNGTETCSEGISCETKGSWLATVRGRVGYAWDPLLPYVTGGMAAGDIEVKRTGFDGASANNVGWVVGGGGEGTLAPHWSVKVEFLYVDLGDFSCSAGNCGVATKIDLHERILRAGLNYRF